ncbi:hypothetical protein DHEL01_v204256 [Diaporthe helianthi]|uniref:F-box domain-containing protein n=1 Tax=Diaporthe helianthi TaxID=158607 RepID=A0A2P5I4E5_DIAHE|nr:hypothetical protein DHEL01_v204256 [Diaporthe helianthi]
MARLQRKQKQRQHQPEQHLNLLPVELLLIILENVSRYEDLASLIASSPKFLAVYMHYKKTILAQITQKTLGHAFIEACMLQHWQNRVDYYGENTDNGTQVGQRVLFLRWLERLERRFQRHDRHIQLKFLHDLGEHASATIEDQIRNMKNLLTVEDFEQIREFNSATVKPLSRQFIEAPRPGNEPHKHFTVTERQRIMRTLYRYEICCHVYGDDMESDACVMVDMGRHHRQMIQADFFGTFDPSENEEFDVVYAGLASEVHKAFHLIAGDLEWKTIMRWRFMYSVPRNNDYDPWTGMPVGMGGVTAGTLAKGLGLLSTIRSAATADEVAAILVARNPPELSNFMWDALTGLEETNRFSEGREDGWPESWSDAFWE